MKFLIRIFERYRTFIKVFLVTIVFPFSYVFLIFGAWLYGRVASAPDEAGIANPDAAFYAAMEETAQAEAKQARLAAANIPPGQRMAKDFNCTACHLEDKKLVGPSFTQVAERYGAEGRSARSQLVEKIKSGGKGNWGEIPMPPHPQYAEEDLAEVVDYILSLTEEEASDSARTSNPRPQAPIPSDRHRKSRARKD